MDHTRRRLLAVTSSLTFPALAGCTGLVGGGSEGDSSTGESSDDGTGGSNAEQTATATETATPTPEPPQDQAFLDRTRAVMDQISWFGSEYERARRRYLLRAKPVQETVATLRERNTLAAADVSELRAKTTALATYVREELAPYFELERRLRNGDNTFVRDFAAAVERGDSQASQDALGRLSVFYNRITAATYIEQHLSAHPIEEPLHGLLQSSSEEKTIFGVSYPPGDNFTTQTFSDEYSDRSDDAVRPHTHTFQTGQRVFDHAHTHGAGHDVTDHTNERPDGLLYTFSQGAVDIMKDTKAWRERLADYEPEYTNVFDAVVAREGRQDYAYVMANRLVTDPSKEAQFGGKPIFLQRFESEERAVSALNTLMETTLGDDGTTTLAGREWRRVYYDYDGANLYANVLQVGEFLLATSVSPEPHTDRTEKDQWPEQLKLSWLGMEVPEGETTETDG